MCDERKSEDERKEGGESTRVCVYARGKVERGR